MVFPAGAEDELLSFEFVCVELELLPEPDVELGPDALVVELVSVEVVDEVVLLVELEVSFEVGEVEF